MTDRAVTDAPTGVQIPTHRLFIAGRWVDGVTGETFESVNPADTRDVVGRFQAGTAADVAMAIRAAEAAAPGWAATPAPKRGEILYRFGALMAEHKERLARAMTREMGKVISEARGDVQEGIDIAFLMAGEGRRMFGDTVPSELPDKWAMSIRQPIGVAGIITPWNFPMAIPCWKMMPALVAGNTVVFKPASDTPHCADAARRAHGRGGLPGRRRQPRHRSGAEVGDAIVDQPRRAGDLVHRLTPRRARRIADRAGRRLKRARLELGGKNAVVVLRDADLDLAIDGILWSAFGTTGQRCTACSRVIVEQAVVEPLLRASRGPRSKLRLGDGLDEAVDVGPLINGGGRRQGRAVREHRPRRGRAGDWAASARPAATSRTATSSSRRSSRGVKPMDRIAQEEIFGPVLSVVPVDDYDEAMTALNQTRYGLSASIFTRDVEHRLPGDARLRDRASST